LKDQDQASKKPCFDISNVEPKLVEYLKERAKITAVVSLEELEKNVKLEKEKLVEGLKILKEKKCIIPVIQYYCPECGSDYDINTPPNTLVQCDICGAEFITNEETAIIYFKFSNESREFFRSILLA